MTMDDRPGITAPASVHQTGTTSLVPPPASSSTLPAKPPRTGSGSATELRTERDRVQGQINDILKVPADTRTDAQNSLLGSLNTRMTSLTEAITKAETPSQNIIPATTGPEYQWQVVDNGDGTASTTLNPNWNGQSANKTQTATVGNHIVVVTPPTKDELAKDPTTQPHVTVAYTDNDAKALADRQTSAAEANARTAAAAQAATEYASKAKVDIDQMVAQGLDAASKRAEVALELQRLQQEWQQSYGDAQLRQKDLTDYEAQRHNQASETLSAQQIQATRDAQAQQDATARRGQDIGAQTSKYATDVGARTAKMQMGSQMLQNSLSILSSINDKLPPGSDLAGKALEGMMAYGQKFLEGLAGSEVKAPDLNGAAPPALAAPGPDNLTPPAASYGNENIGSGAASNPQPPTSVDIPVPPSYNPSAAGSRLTGGEATGGTPIRAPVSNFDFSAAGSRLTGGEAAGGTPIRADMTIADQLAAANDAAHQATMAAPVRLAPDGTPMATAADVARIFGRGV